MKKVNDYSVNCDPVPDEDCVKMFQMYRIP